MNFQFFDSTDRLARRAAELWRVEELEQGDIPCGEMVPVELDYSCTQDLGHEGPHLARAGLRWAAVWDEGNGLFFASPDTESRPS